MSTFTAENKYHVVLTFPERIFPVEENECKDDREGRLCRIFKGYIEDHCQEGVAHREYGDTQNFHIDAIIGLSRPAKLGNLKRSILSYMGVPRSAQLEMQAFEKKHCCKVKKVNWLPGIVRYNMKEGHHIVTKGFSTTWLQEQAEIGRKEHATREKEVFVNDGNFFKLCNEYAISNNIEDKELEDIFVRMDREGYNFSRVRNLRYQIHHWRNRKAKDDTRLREYFRSFDI